MKLRQKLAMVLATAITVTAVPVVTMADSKNAITRPNTVTSEGTVYSDPTTAPALRVDFEGFEGTVAAPEEFYLTLTNADWNADLDSFSDASVKLTRISDKVAKVEVSSIPAAGTTFAGNATTSIKLPLLVKLGEGAASVALTAEGSNSTITEGSYTFANTSEEIATVTAGSPTSFNKEGKIGTIKIAEAYMGSMKKASASEYNYALIELNDADYKFDLTQGIVSADTTNLYAPNAAVNAFAVDNTKGTYKMYVVNANYTYGFGGKGLNSVTVFVSQDGDSMYVQLPNNITAYSKGVIELNSLYVKATVKSPTEGNLSVDVSGDVKDATNLVVAINGDFEAIVTAKDDKAVEILAGQTEEVEFKLKEAVDGTFTNGREFSVALDNGYFMAAKLDAKGDVDEDATLIAMEAAFSNLQHDAGSTVVDDYSVAEIAAAITSVDIQDEKVVGFTFKPSSTYTTGELDSITFTTKLSGAIDQKGEVKVSVMSRDLLEAATAVVANIRPAVEVTSEAAVLKTGLIGQEGGKIAITETEAGVLTRGEKLYVFLPEVSGISFSTASDKLPEVTVKSGDLQVSDVKIEKVTNNDGDLVQALVMTIKRESKTASAIEITNFHIDTDRTVAEGKYDAELGGKALTAHNETIKLANFVTIATANTEDLVATNGLAKGTSKFVIGESKFTLNGVQTAMDAQSYIQDPGYTMIPVRFVAQAFGVKGSDILFSKGTVTMFAGTRTIQLTSGSDIAIVNGAQVKLATKVAIKNGRTYAPVGEIARILGVSASWDNTAKTATFTN